MTTYRRGTSGLCNDIAILLGSVKSTFWPFAEGTDTTVASIGVGPLAPKETGGGAQDITDLSPFQMPCSLYSYYFDSSKKHHLAGIDHANFTFGDGAADSAFSVGCCLRPSELTEQTLIGKYDSAGGAEEWRLFIDSTGHLSLELHDASASASEVATAASVLAVGQWVQVVVTYDGGEAAPVVKLYVNGVLVSDGSTVETGAYVAMEDTATPLTVACSGVTATPLTLLHGRMAMPFVTGKELSAADVAALFAIQAPMIGLC